MEKVSAQFADILEDCAVPTDHILPEVARGELLADDKRAAGGDSLTVYDITNPVAPTLRWTLTGFSTNLMSAFGSRLYVQTTANQFKTIELSDGSPINAVRSSFTPGVIPPAYRRSPRRREWIDGIRVERTWTYARPGGSIRLRLANQLSFTGEGVDPLLQ